MLGKMLIHGLVGAAVIASAAAVFAQAKDNGTLKPDALPAVVADTAKPAGPQVGTAAARDTGYLTDRQRGREHKKDERRREGRHHDDDDDD